MDQNVSPKNGYRIGPYHAFSIDNGRFALDGGAMNGSIPRTLWEKYDPPNEMNRITLAVRSLLLISDTHRILVDCGPGDKWNDKLADIYEIESSYEATVQALAQTNTTPEQITHVVISHLHFDHVGGATRRVGDDIVPTFLNARYLIQKKQWDWANSPCDLDAASYLPDDFLPLEKAGQLQLIDGEHEVLPGLTTLVFDGHTPGMQCPLIQADGKSLFYCADLIPLVSHIRYPYIMAYDLAPTETLMEKLAILPRAIDEDWVLFFEHDNLHCAITLSAGKRYPQIGTILDF